VGLPKVETFVSLWYNDYNIVGMISHFGPTVRCKADGIWFSKFIGS